MTTPDEHESARSSNWRAALESAAKVEAEWDGRDFDALGRAEKARYVERLDAAIKAYYETIFELTQPPKPSKPPVGA